MVITAVAPSFTPGKGAPLFYRRVPLQGLGEEHWWGAAGSARENKDYADKNLQGPRGQDEGARPPAWRRARRWYRKEIPRRATPIPTALAQRPNASTRARSTR